MAVAIAVLFITGQVVAWGTLLGATMALHASSDSIDYCETFDHDWIEGGISGLMQFPVCRRCGKWERYYRSEKA